MHKKTAAMGARSFFAKILSTALHSRLSNVLNL